LSLYDDRQAPEQFVQLTDAQASVLRKHLGRGSLSLDDAAILVGVAVEDLAQHFQGRRAGERRPESSDSGEPRRERTTRRDAYAHSNGRDDEDGLRAPVRRERRASQGGGRWIWIGGAAAAVTVVGALAVFSGAVQSLLFPPRGVSEHKSAEAPADAVQSGTPAEDGSATVALGPAESEPAAPPASTEPVIAEAPPEAVPDPTLAADPNAAPPVDPAAPVDAPLPPPPEDVAPAVATAEADVPVAAPALPSADPIDPVAPQPAAGTPATLYAARAASVRDAPTATGSTVVGQLKRGDSVGGAVIAGADGKSPWLRIESGPLSGGYVSLANMADGPRPAIVQAIGQPRVLTQPAALHAGPDENSAALDTLSPGASVMAAAEVGDGWIEINRRAGGVGYIRKEAFQ
jgi:hypothetical protein